MAKKKGGPNLSRLSLILCPTCGQGELYINKCTFVDQDCAIAFRPHRKLGYEFIISKTRTEQLTEQQWNVQCSSCTFSMSGENKDEVLTELRTFLEKSYGGVLPVCVSEANSTETRGATENDVRESEGTPEWARLITRTKVTQS